MYIFTVVLDSVEEIMLLQTLFSTARRRTSNVISTQLQMIAATEPTINNKNTPSTFAISKARAPPSSLESYES